MSEEQIRLTRTRASEIATFLGAPLIGNDLVVNAPASLQRPGARTLVFVKEWGPEIEARLSEVGEMCALVPPTAAGGCPVSHIVVDNPRLAFADVVREMFAPPAPTGVEATALIDSTVRLGRNVYVGHYAVLEAGVVVGDQTVIGHHTILSRNVRVGRRCRIKPHAVLGGDGFGFESRADGSQVRIPHLGSVELGDDVEIGSFVSIASGTLDDTVLADGVKVDDHVFLAHNVHVGEHAMIIAGAEVSGSVEIGREAWIAPQVSVLNKIRIGDRALVGIGSVVVRDVPAGMVVAGNPARVVRPR